MLSRTAAMASVLARDLTISSFAEQVYGDTLLCKYLVQLSLLCHMRDCRMRSAASGSGRLMSKMLS